MEECHKLYKHVYPFGLNLFFQPGLGPGFFFTLDSSGVFGLRLLFRIAPFRALAEKCEGITAGLLTSAIFWAMDTETHLLSEYGSNRSSSDILSFLLSSSSSSEMPLDAQSRVITVDVIQNLLNAHVTDVSQINGQKETDLSDRSLSATLSSSWAGGETASSGPEKSGVERKPQVHQPRVVQPAVSNSSDEAAQSWLQMFSGCVWIWQRKLKMSGWSV